MSAPLRAKVLTCSDGVVAGVGVPAAGTTSAGSRSGVLVGGIMLATAHTPAAATAMTSPSPASVRFMSDLLDRPSEPRRHERATTPG